MSGSLPMSSGRRGQLQKKLHASVAISAADGDGEDASRKAVMNVVQVWLDRLQLISLITTFFASIDGTLLSFTISLTHIGSLDNNQWPNTIQLMNASLAGALIFHVCASITAFVGSFILIRYKLNGTDLRRSPVPPLPSSIVATPVEKSNSARYSSDRNATLTDAPPLSSTRSRSHNGTSEHHGSSTPFIQATEAELVQVFQSWSEMFTQLEGRVYIHTVRPFFSFRSRANCNGTDAEPPVRLLSNCHTLSVWMAVAGFVLALLGILTFAWTSLPTSIGAFASVCLGMCMLALFATLSFS